MSGKVCLLSVEQLNNATEEEFSKYVCYIFEKSSLVNKIYQHRPYDSYTQLINVAEEWCKTNTFTDEELIALINAHPRLGIANCRLSVISQMEQQQIKEEEDLIIQRLGELNEQYETKFGFRFVIFVNGRSGREIIPIFEERINNSAKGELNTAVLAVFDIARCRLEKLTPL